MLADIGEPTASSGARPPESSIRRPPTHSNGLTDQSRSKVLSEAMQPERRNGRRAGLKCRSSQEGAG